MFAQIPERRMHWIRWVVTTGWVLLILSLFFDPWTAALTQPDHPWSPLRLTGECVPVQGVCVEETPQPIGATLFWGAIVPSGIFILLVFSHELWRRICPLSFLSQIPRALGWQRQFKRENPKTGKVRYELAKVRPESWLGRNYLYVQFAYLFVGLCGRILFFNADRLVLGGWLVFTIVAAMAVGYFYGGKSWCQYICPMAPVQTVFSEPRGLLGSQAHTSESRITQSMCRTVEADGSEKSACVACQSPCFDIDSERTYWDGLRRRDEAVMRYGYLGLMVGYFVYYYLYAGNWDYYFSGVWNRDPNQLAALFSPGLYLGGQAIAIPKLVAVPLVLGAFTLGGIGLGTLIANRAKGYSRKSVAPNPDRVQHRIFVIVAFIAFNFFFFFAGRPLLRLTPGWVQFGFDGLVLFLSTLWLQQSWHRSPERYTRENLASRFRNQLAKLGLEVAALLDGRSLDDLHADEVYVLAKVLPDFTREKRHQAYKGVVREALAEGYINTANSLDVLQQMRQELGISADEHQEILEELGVEDPDLLNPDRQRSLENQVRISGYQRSLERLLRLQQAQPNLMAEAEVPSLQSLRQEYAITPQEEAWVLSGLSAQGRQKAEGLMACLREWLAYDHALTLPALQAQAPVVDLVLAVVRRKQGLIVRSLLETLATLPATEALPLAQTLAQTLNSVTPSPLADYLASDLLDQLAPEVVNLLQATPPEPAAPLAPPTDTDTLSYLANLIDHPNPLVPAAALFLIAQIDPARAQGVCQTLAPEATSALTQATAQVIQSHTAAPDLAAIPDLEKVVYLAHSDFFSQLQPKTLLALAALTEVRTYAPGDAITHAGDTCRELLILINGEASIHYQRAEGVVEERFHPGQTLDELEVLAHANLDNAILADGDHTRILAVPVDAFDSLIDHDPDFARRVIALESQRLQQIANPLAPTQSMH
ncbi:cyclic nucleotide-binding domain-containing protein [Phormidium sp. FACHB-1136]|uniref:cyclic nucleotide-binding domain-containing protein n=1 Tax=Phormidium sp. FACHB-1136 TaxID=2692848 RepID=UPI0016893612|nr:cyclic nucleotide-binding domain-containing protein [Phormidium sp. FACHB-1136]MBD2429243.1 cyclic nucleotide-binding domain-containing protein [Phormidium sp. FACHB-1136]